MGRIFAGRPAADAVDADAENKQYSRTVSSASTLAVGGVDNGAGAGGAHDNPAFVQSCQTETGERIKSNAETTYL